MVVCKAESPANREMAPKAVHGEGVNAGARERRNLLRQSWFNHRRECSSTESGGPACWSGLWSLPRGAIGHGGAAVLSDPPRHREVACTVMQDRFATHDIPATSCDSSRFPERPHPLRRRRTPYTAARATGFMLTFNRSGMGVGIRIGQPSKRPGIDLNTSFLMSGNEPACFACAAGARSAVPSTQPRMSVIAVIREPLWRATMHDLAL
jgi:hypothetical protein